MSSSSKGFDESEEDEFSEGNISIIEEKDLHKLVSTISKILKEIIHSYDEKKKCLNKGISYFIKVQKN